MEAAAFFDRLAASVAASPRAVTALRRELAPPKSPAHDRAVELEAEMDKGRRAIAAGRERWLAERRKTA